MFCKYFTKQYINFEFVAFSGSVNRMRLPDGSGDFDGQVRERHLHRPAANDADTKAGSNHGTGHYKFF